MWLKLIFNPRVLLSIVIIGLIYYSIHRIAANMTELNEIKHKADISEATVKGSNSLNTFKAVQTTERMKNETIKCVIDTNCTTTLRL